VGLSRQCTKTGCARRAVATLTYVYRDQTAVLGPLATYAEPHTYDLCHDHAERLTVPRGWEVVRLELDDVPPHLSHDDLLAVADAVREDEHAGDPAPDRTGVPARTPSGPPARPGLAVTAYPPAPETIGARRGHLRAVRDP